MSLNYISASSLDRKIDRLSNLISYTTPPAPVIPTKSLTVNNVTSVTSTGSPIAANVLSFTGTSSYVSILDSNASWAASADNSTDGGVNGKLQFRRQGQLTVECYVKFSALDNIGFIDFGTNGATIGYASGQGWFFGQTGVTYGMLWTAAASTNTWYHAAWTRHWPSGANPTFEFFLNGVSQGTRSVANDYTGTTPFGSIVTPALGLMAGANRFLPGEMQEFRISNIRRYTANFTPSTTPFVRDSNTVLLIRGTSPIVDASS